MQNVYADRLTRRAPSRPLAGWFAARPWYPIFGVLLFWTLAPGLRRLVDWKSGFSVISIISVLPLVSILPLAFALIYSDRLRHLDRRLAMCAWLWLGGFAYALAVGVAAGNTQPALYTFLEFVLPAALGLWVATLDVERSVLYERVADFLLLLALPLCIYAVIQFTAPPAWDVQWMLNAKITAIGKPYPFELRPFSTLNSPGTFGDFLVAAIAFNLPRMRGARPLQIGALALCSATLILTMVRSGWIAAIVALVVYVALSPNRARNLAYVGSAIALGAILTLNASALLGSDAAGNGLAQRFSTFSDISDDRSFNERSTYFGDKLTTAFEQPTGEGLGVTGTAAKLGAVGQTVDFDNGYVARFTEMGYFGTLCYAAVLAYALALGIGAWRAARRAGSRERAAFAAAALAVQCALLFLDISSDHHSGLAGLFFWLSLAFTYGRRAE